MTIVDDRELEWTREDRKRNATLGDARPLIEAWQITMLEIEPELEARLKDSIAAEITHAWGPDAEATFHPSGLVEATHPDGRRLIFAIAGKGA